MFDFIMIQLALDRDREKQGCRGGGSWAQPPCQNQESFWGTQPPPLSIQ